MPNPLSRFLPCLTALPLLALLAAPALAAPTLNDLNLGAHASGPQIKASDLRGHVVVFEYWGQHCPPCLASIPHLAEIQAKYPYQSLIVIANQCQGGDAKNAAKVWTNHQGGDKVVVINNGDLQGANVSGIPRVFVFNALGKCVFDGSPHSSKFNDAIEGAVKSSPGAAIVARILAAQAKARELFGKEIPDDLMEVAMQAADTSHSSMRPMQLLALAAKNRNPKIGPPAKAMVETFNKAVAAAFATGEATAQTDPAAAFGAMETLVRWAPQAPEGAKARALLSKWRRDPAIVKEVDADKAWSRLQAQAERVDFEKHPDAKPTSMLTSEYIRLLNNTRFAGTKAVKKAKAAAPGWNIDPETGKPVPYPKNKV